MKQYMKIQTKKTEFEDGWIGFKEFKSLTGLSERRIHYWANSGVFGEPREIGSGFNRVWHRDAVPVARVLSELAAEFGEFNGVTMPLLKDIVENFDVGHVMLSDHIKLEWSIPK